MSDEMEDRKTSEKVSERASDRVMKKGNLIWLLHAGGYEQMAISTCSKSKWTLKNDDKVLTYPVNFSRPSMFN